jgi:hypothetical protein
VKTDRPGQGSGNVNDNDGSASDSLSYVVKDGSSSRLAFRSSKGQASNIGVGGQDETSDSDDDGSSSLKRKGSFSTVSSSIYDVVIPGDIDGDDGSNDGRDQFTDAMSASFRDDRGVDGHSDENQSQ